MARSTIDRLIVNSPAEQPAHHWRYDCTTHRLDLAPSRRPAGYVVASEDSRAFDDPGTRASWSNSKVGIDHGYTLVRQAAERIIRKMNVEDKTREVASREAARQEARPESAEAPARQRGFSIVEILPPHDPGSWPQDFTVSREQIYDDMGRLTGGPEDLSGDDR